MAALLVALLARSVFFSGKMFTSRVGKLSGLPSTKCLPQTREFSLTLSSVSFSADNHFFFFLCPQEFETLIHYLPFLLDDHIQHNY